MHASLAFDVVALNSNHQKTKRYFNKPDLDTVRTPANVSSRLKIRMVHRTWVWSSHHVCLLGFGGITTEPMEHAFLISKRMLNRPSYKISFILATSSLLCFYVHNNKSNRKIFIKIKKIIIKEYQSWKVTDINMTN